MVRRACCFPHRDAVPAPHRGSRYCRCRNALPLLCCETSSDSSRLRAHVCPCSTPLHCSLSPACCPRGSFSLLTLQELLCAPAPRWAPGLAETTTPRIHHCIHLPSTGRGHSWGQCLLIPKWLGEALSTLALDPTCLRGHRGPLSMWGGGEKAWREAGAPLQVLLPYFPSRQLLSWYPLIC